MVRSLPSSPQMAVLQTHSFDAHGRSQPIVSGSGIMPFHSGHRSARWTTHQPSDSSRFPNAQLASITYHADTAIAFSRQY